jgi:hypothetical protein
MSASLFLAKEKGSVYENAVFSSDEYLAFIKLDKFYKPSDSELYTPTQ